MKISEDFIITDTEAGKRLDVALAGLMSDYSRSRIQSWINSGEILVNNEQVITRYKVKSGDQICVRAMVEANDHWQAQEMALDIIHEDDNIIIINKPAGLVVHPAAGNHDGTLVNALLFHDANLAKLPRAGLVHRLDKDTSGLLVIAKTLTAHASLVEQLQTRSMHREYEAIVYGSLTGGGCINAAIGRHPNNRLKMAVKSSGKEAITHYRIIERLQHFTHIQVNLETGRTHQIRVHMAHIHHAIIGDPLYSRLSFPKGLNENLKPVLSEWRRQALHARQLSLIHPATGEEVSFTCPLPQDMQQLLSTLKEYDGETS